MKTVLKILIGLALPFIMVLTLLWISGEVFNAKEIFESEAFLTGYFLYLFIIPTILLTLEKK